MSIPALCTHVHASGATCQSPAVRGTALCYHHSAVKIAFDQVAPLGTMRAVRAPIPFVFAEDHASLQINYALLLQALNEHRVDPYIVNVMLRILRAMAQNLRQSPLAESTNPSTEPPAITSIVSTPAPREEQTAASGAPPSRHGAEAEPAASCDAPASASSETVGREMTEYQRKLAEYFGGFDKIPAIHLKNATASSSQRASADVPAQSPQISG